MPPIWVSSYPALAIRRTTKSRRYTPVHATSDNIAYELRSFPTFSLVTHKQTHTYNCENKRSLCLIALYDFNPR
jgi:hypothetical protein